MLLQRQYSRWVTATSVVLALIGFVAVVYGVVVGIRALTR
jgi:hypothetical protein